MASLPVLTAPDVYVGRYARRARAAAACETLSSRGPTSGRLTYAGRLLALVLSGTCLSLLVMAAGLSPSPGGFGTHRQLGLQECGFLVRTGLPCPACGMTTSFAWFARGNVLASFYVQPMGCALALICALCVWAGGYVAITGKPLQRIVSVIPEKLYLIPLFTLATAAWAWKMYSYRHGIGGW